MVMIVVRTKICSKLQNVCDTLVQVQSVEMYDFYWFLDIPKYMFFFWIYSVVGTLIRACSSLPRYFDSTFRSRLKLVAFFVVLRIKIYSCCQWFVSIHQISSEFFFLVRMPAMLIEPSCQPTTNKFWFRKWNLLASKNKWNIIKIRVYACEWFWISDHFCVYNFSFPFNLVKNWFIN